MANNFTLEYESTANTFPNNVELNYGSPYIDGLTVHAALYAGAGFTATHYKIWGIRQSLTGQIVTVSDAEWVPFTESTTVYLVNNSEAQYAYVKFKNASETETEVFQSNPVTFSYTEPVKNASGEWKQTFTSLGYGTSISNIFTNNNANIEVLFSKNNIDQLSFSGRDFSGIRISENSVYIDPNSEIGRVLLLGGNDYLNLSKIFDHDEVPFITVTISGITTTLTTYDFQEKTTISGNSNLSGRVDNIVWESLTKELSFNAHIFSEYGFCTIQKIEFDNISQTGAYVGETATFYAYVQDTNGDPVENAPVSLSGISGNIGTIQEAMPVYTNDVGIAEFNLSVSSIGSVVYNAYIDSFSTDPNITIFGVEVVDRYRSLLTQYEQIYKTYNFYDTVSGVNTPSVAEPTTPTVSGSSDSVLEHDLNVLRTLIKQVKGTINWYDELPNYFNPSNTDIVDTENNSLNLMSLKNNTLDAKTIIIAVSEDNSGAGFNLSVGSEGFLFSTTFNYATYTNNCGLPIYHSTVNSGIYCDTNNVDSVVGIDLIDLSTGAEFKDINDDIVYAKFCDGADYGGSGDGTDIYVKLYTASGTYTTVSGDPASIMMVYPYRKTLSNMEEYEWLRTDFVSSWEGDDVVVDYISDLWSYTGTSNDEYKPIWNTISGSPVIDSTINSLLEATNAVNYGVGSRLYLEHNYISNGQSIADSLDELDINLYDLSQSVAGIEYNKYVVDVSSDINLGISYELPNGMTYTPYSGSGQEGGNMDIYLNGQLLSASTGSNGVNQDRDYMETDSTHVTFFITIPKYSILTFVIRE